MWLDERSTTEKYLHKSSLQEEVAMVAAEFCLTKDQVNFYDMNGYLIVDDILTSQECDDAFFIFERYALPDFRGIMNIDRECIEYREFGKTVGGKEVVGFIEVKTADATHIRNIMRDRKIVTILEQLQRADVVALQTMFLFKKAGTRYADQAWNPHQDNAYPQAAYGMYITGNLMLEDHDPKNGGMFIFPGSHREPLLPSRKVRSFHEGSGENPGHSVIVPKQYKKIDLVMKKGSILMLHGHVIHGSYSNRSPHRSRPMFSIPYITAGADFYPGKTSKRTPISLK